jgi:hypothetical protein
MLALVGVEEQPRVGLLACERHHDGLGRARQERRHAIALPLPPDPLKHIHHLAHVTVGQLPGVPEPERTGVARHPLDHAVRVEVLRALVALGQPHNLLGAGLTGRLPSQHPKGRLSCAGGAGRHGAARVLRLRCDEHCRRRGLWDKY